MALHTATRQTPRLPRYHRALSYPPVTIGRPKKLILEAIGHFHYLTAPQLTALLFHPGSLTYVQRHCKELFHAGYLRRVYLPKITPLGSSKAIYALDNPGYRYLRSLGLAPEGRFRPSEQARREYLYLEHTLCANDFLILAHRLARESAGIVISDMKTERELKRRASWVQDGKERLYVVPDGWLDLHVSGSHRACFALELDRGSVAREAFQKKIRGLIRYAGGPYQEAFGTESLTVLFVTTAGQERLGEMLRWTGETITATNAEDQADLLRFAAFRPDQIEPAQAFLAPIWSRPFGSGGLALIPDPGG